jgi:hypothetical protein
VKAGISSPTTRPETDPTGALRPGREVAALALILLAGAALRGWMLLGPLGEVEADESVVGLMALHILNGERPAFYWGQAYLGSLEAYLAAAAFALTGPSNLVLKLVPALAFLVFVLATYLAARRDYGRPVALASALYLALPPSFLAIWSLKARGGYIELLAVGQLMLLLAGSIGLAIGGTVWRAGLLGLLSGVALWIHVLGLVYLLPSLLLLLRLPFSRLAAALVAWLAGLLVGAAPLLLHNLATEGDTLAALAGSGTTLESVQRNLRLLLQVGLPVMVGLGQPTSSPILFALDWPTRPGSQPWVAATVLAVLLVLIAPRFAEARLGRWSGGPPTAATLLGLAIALLGPLMASLGRFGELVAEPRYALPLYATTGMLFASLLGWPARLRRSRLPLVALLLGLNAYSLLTVEPVLNLPTSAAGSTAANRAELIRALEQAGLYEIYTDYWLAYPLIFESQERLAAAVHSGGYDRLPAYAHLVANSRRPAYVFIADSPAERSFLEQAGPAARADKPLEVSIYRVYVDPSRARGIEPPNGQPRDS